MVGDLHSDTCLLPKVALPKVQVARLEADARASQLHPDACQNRQHLSCHCHLQQESTVSWAHGFAELLHVLGLAETARPHRVAACLRACRHSEDNIDVADVNDMGRAKMS